MGQFSSRMSRKHTESQTPPSPQEIHTVVSISEYRKQTNDYKTPDDVIQKRLEYLEALCRNIAREELEKYEKSL